MKYNQPNEKINAAESSGLKIITITYIIGYVFLRRILHLNSQMRILTFTTLALFNAIYPIALHALIQCICFSETSWFTQYATSTYGDGRRWITDKVNKMEEAKFMQIASKCKVIKVKKK